MKRGVTLISVAITAFSIVIIASVVYGYRVSAGPQSAPLSAPAPGPSPELISASSVTTATFSARDAAAVASEFLGRTDAYSVQLAAYNGVQAYKVTFLSGDVVYVSLEGEILGSELPSIQLASSNGGRRDDRDGSSGEHDDGEHEVEHEDGG